MAWIKEPVKPVQKSPEKEEIKTGKHSVQEQYKSLYGGKPVTGKNNG